MLAPNARSASAAWLNDTAKTTPAKTIGVNASRQDAGHLQRAGEAEEGIDRHERAREEREDQPRVERHERSRSHGEDEQVRDQNHHQHRTEHDRVDEPRAAKQQRHLHDRLGLDQHEAGAEEEHLREEAEARDAAGDRGCAGLRRRTNGSTNNRPTVPMIAIPRRLSDGIIGRCR